MDQKELLRTIAQAAEEGWTSLDLSNQGLTELPPEVGELTNLKELNLRRNQLTSLPCEIGKLINLTNLKLTYNRLIEIPNEIEQLVNLIELDLRTNQLKWLSPNIGNLRNLKILGLSDNPLIMLPSEIGKLTSMEKLFLINDHLSSLPPEIKNLTKLKYIYLSNNPLPIPSEVLKLNRAPQRIIAYYFDHQSTIPSITLHSNQIQEINLLQLIEQAIRDGSTSLDLSYQKLSTLPPDIGKLNKLKQLDLRGNQLLTLPPEIGNLMDLMKLDLRGNQLTALPSEIGMLSHLNELDLRYNYLTKLPQEMKKLKDLQKLGLGDNQIVIFPYELFNLSNLTDLFLSDNQLTILPPEIGILKNLVNIRFDGNKLTSIPSEIGELYNLKELKLKKNQISVIPEEIGKLVNLIELELQDNKITHLPSEIKRLAGLQKLYLQGNPLPIPPEILELRNEPQKILNFYFQQGQKKPLNEVKVLIVGQGAVGKTSLIKRLLEDKFDPHETKTDGIAINHWRLNIDGSQIRLNVWDFGGQEIMHATHQFFLTKRSLYVLVLDSRLSEQENRLEYWLKIIQSFGGDSPVIVVCNKNDQHDLDLDWKGLQNKYPSIKAFAKTISCKTGDGIPQLKTQIEREVAQLEHLHDELILPWFAVKTQLEEMQRDYISYGDYQQMCQQADVSDELSQQTLLGFLHDLGIVLHFHDHPLLEDTNVLNPAWVTRGVYQLLNSNELFQRKGELDHKALERILDPHTYPRSKHQFIIDMMRKFELCFDFAEFSGERFLVPDLLAKEEPYTGEWADSLAFQYHYDILPGSVLSRFMVRMHAYIHQRTYWRNGVVLISEDGKNRALVKADLEDKIIFIFVSGKPKTRHLFLELIRADFRKIHKTIPKLAVTEVVPLPGKPDVLIDYTDLLKLRERGIKTYYYPKADAEINVDQLLDGLEPGKGQSMLSAGLQRDIVAFLASIPGIQDRNAQHALIYSAGLDAQLQQRINFSGATAQFFELLVPQLSGYGRLADGRLALTAVLQAAKEQVGHDRQIYCDTLIHAVQREFAE